MSTIGVTAAVIERNGKFLIAKRKAGKHLAGKWEFPGGKTEAGESPEQCLMRELREEFGIEATIGDFIVESIFHYNDRTIRLLGYRATYIRGEFVLDSHDEIRWIGADEFGDYDFAPADIRLIKQILI